MAAYGLYTHIQSNKVRSAVLLIGLFFLVYVLTYAGALIAGVILYPEQSYDWYMANAIWDTRQAAPFVTVGTIAWIFIAYKFHQSMIDQLTGGELVTRNQQPRLYNALENLCISRGIPMPKLKVMESDALNAFATGMSEKQYSITVTTGLIKRLNDAEIEAVLGHELTHIRNGDVRLMVIAVIIAGVVSFAGEMIFRILFNSGRTGGSYSSGGSGSSGSSWSSGSSSSSSSGSSDKKGGGGAIIVIVIALVLIALAWLLSVVIRMALSRSREMLADAGSVELTKNPDAMITALRKIEGRGELPGATSAIMEMCVDNPREEFADLFATHPSVDRRVAALVQFAGGHDPGKIDDPEPQIEDQTADGTPPEASGPQDASPGTTSDPAGPWGSQGGPSPGGGDSHGAGKGPWGTTPKP